MLHGWRDYNAHRRARHDVQGREHRRAIFSPLWVVAIGALGFSNAAAAIGLVMALTMRVLADSVFACASQQIGLAPDGDVRGTQPTSVTSPAAKPLPGALLWSIPGRQTRRASASLQGIRRRRPHRQSAVGTRSRSGESRSSGPPKAVTFVVRSTTNLPFRLQHFVLPDAEGYGSRVIPAPASRTRWFFAGQLHGISIS